jgi:hypothetical protein
MSLHKIILIVLSRRTVLFSMQLSGTFLILKQMSISCHFWEEAKEMYNCQDTMFTTHLFSKSYGAPVHAC